MTRYANGRSIVAPMGYSNRNLWKESFVVPEGFCPGGMEVYSLERGGKGKTVDAEHYYGGVPREPRIVRCKVCGKRLRLFLFGHAEADGYALPHHKARVTRAKGAKRVVQATRRGK